MTLRYNADLPCWQSLVEARQYHPKLIRLEIGNLTNDHVLDVLLTSAERLEAALGQSDIGVVVISA